MMFVFRKFSYFVCFLMSQHVFSEKVPDSSRFLAIFKYCAGNGAKSIPVIYTT